MNHNNYYACELVDKIRNKILENFRSGLSYIENKELVTSELWEWYIFLDNYFDIQGYNHVVSLIISELNRLYNV